MKKFLQEKNTTYDETGSDSYWVELRYAEVLMNMAEAYAQSGDVQTGYEYLNKVRTRGNELSGYSVGSNLQIFMNCLEKEKMVEFAFEGLRYWDLRRWRRAVAVIDGQRAHGIKITKNSDNSLTYTKVVCDDDDRYFPEKYYYIPIPTSEINNNSACIQTELW